MLLLYRWTSKKKKSRIFPNYAHDTGMPFLPAWSSLIVLFWSPLAVLANVVPTIGAKLLPDVYWNSSSSIFRADTTDHVINVNIRDQLNIRCPVYNNKSVLNDADHFEYSEIYNVPKWSYDNCVLTSDAKIVGVCRNPVNLPESIITVVFREFTPLPSGLEFTPGKSYYFITTSDGSQAGLSNRKGGLCSTKNMKLKFIVHHQAQKSTSSSPPVDSSTKHDFNSLRAKNAKFTVAYKNLINNEQQSPSRSRDTNDLSQQNSRRLSNSDEDNNNLHNQYSNSLELGSNYHHRTSLVNGGNYPSNSNSNNSPSDSTATTTTTAIIWYEIHTRHPGDDFRTSNTIDERSTRDYTNYYGSSSKRTANSADLNLSRHHVVLVLLFGLISIVIR